MSIEIIVPRLGWSMEKGAFVAWLKKDGESVRAGEPLFSIEGDKAVVEIESIDSGILHIAPNGPTPGAPIRVGDVLGHLVSLGEASPTSTRASITEASPAPMVKSASPSAKPSISQILVPAESIARARSTPAISPRALRVAAELGVDWTAIAGSGRTGRIRERDIRAAAASSLTSQALTAESATSSAMEKDPTFLVTGGCGFIGTWVLRELLQRGMDVVVFDTDERPARWERVLGAGSKQVRHVRGSLLDRALLARVFDGQNVTHVIHLAALLTPACQADPWEGCRVNVLGTVSLFEELRRCAARIRGVSYASSVAVFGDEAGEAGSTSAGGNEPLTFYGAFKKAVELIAGQYWRQFQLASVGIRPQVAYGPERDVGLTAGPSLAARAAARDEAFTISYTGRVGYDYVEDVARAFVRGAMDTPSGAHVADLAGEVAEVEEVLAAIGVVAPASRAKLSVSGAPIPAHAPSNPCYINTIYPDWRTTSLGEGIRRTVEFYRVQN